MFLREQDNNIRGRTLMNPREQQEFSKQAAAAVAATTMVVNSQVGDLQQDLRTRRTTAKMAQLLQPSLAFAQQSPSQSKFQQLWGNNINNANTNIELHNSSGQSKSSCQNVLIPAIKDLNQERMIQRMKSRTIHSDSSGSKLDNAIFQADANTTLTKQRPSDASPSSQSGNSFLNERTNAHILSTTQGYQTQNQARSQSREKELVQSTNLNCLENEWSKMKKDHNFDNRSQSPFRFQPPFVNNPVSSANGFQNHRQSVEEIPQKEPACSQERSMDSHRKQLDNSQNYQQRQMISEQKTQQKTLIKKSVPLSKINLELIKNDSFQGRQQSAGRKTPKSASSAGLNKTQTVSQSAQKYSTMNSTNSGSSQQLSNRPNRSKDSKEEPHFQTIVDKYSNIHKKQGSNQTNLSSSYISNSGENSGSHAANHRESGNFFEIPQLQSSSSTPQPSRIQTMQPQVLQQQSQQQNYYPYQQQFSQQKQNHFQMCPPSNNQQQQFYDNSSNKYPQSYPVFHRQSSSSPSSNPAQGIYHDTISTTNNNLQNNEDSFSSKSSQFYNFSSKPNYQSSQTIIQTVSPTQPANSLAGLNTPSRHKYTKMSSQQVSNINVIESNQSISQIEQSNSCASISRNHNAVKIMSPKINDLKIISNRNNNLNNNSNTSYGSHSILQEANNQQLYSDSMQNQNSFNSDFKQQTNSNKNLPRIIQNSSTNNCKERDVKQLIMSKIHKMNVAKIYLKEEEVGQNSSSASAGDASTSFSNSERNEMDFTRAHNSLMAQNDQGLHQQISPEDYAGHKSNSQQIVMQGYQNTDLYLTNQLNSSNISIERQQIGPIQYPSRFEQQYQGQLNKQSSSSNLQNNSNSCSNIQMNTSFKNNASNLFSNLVENSQNNQLIAPFSSTRTLSSQNPEFMSKQSKENQLILPNQFQENILPLQQISQNKQAFVVNTLPALKNEALSSSYVFQRVNPLQTSQFANCLPGPNDSRTYENQQINYVPEEQKMQQRIEQPTSFSKWVANAPQKNFVLQPQPDQRNMGQEGNMNSSSVTHKKTFPFQERPFLRSSSQENYNQFAYSQNNQNHIDQQNQQQQRQQLIASAVNNGIPKINCNNINKNMNSQVIINTGYHTNRTQHLSNSSISTSAISQQVHYQQNAYPQNQPSWGNSIKIAEKIESNSQFGSYQNPQIQKLNHLQNGSSSQTQLVNRQQDQYSKSNLQSTIQNAGDQQQQQQSKLKKAGSFFMS